MLKPCLKKNKLRQQTQPPSGGCVLKHFLTLGLFRATMQPPSGGCVLKHVVLFKTFAGGENGSRLRAAVC